MADLTTPTAIESARDALHPTQLGFELRRGVPLNERQELAWQKDIDGIGLVYFSQLSWQHANQYFQWGDEIVSGLDVINRLQHDVWLIEPNKLTSSLDMSTIVDTGGYIGIAYRAETGLTPAGWLGFVLGYGSRYGVLSSRFLAVHGDARHKNLARDLKLLQGYMALEAGHFAAEWTFDPMRSVNAHLNFNKLGAFAERYKINKYGEFKSALYGDVPSDRFVVRWNLTDPAVIAHLQGEHHHAELRIDDIPTIAPANLQIALQEQWPVVKLPVPYDIDTLMQSERDKAMQVRGTVRAVCTVLLDAEIPDVGTTDLPDPAATSVAYQSGNYRLTRVVADADHQHSFYIFQLKDATV